MSESIITPEFVDLQFDDMELPEGIQLGVQPQSEQFMFHPEFGFAGERFANNNIIIPESMWQEQAPIAEKAARNSIRNRHNQGNEGSCVGNALVGMVESVMYRTGGLKQFTKLSACFAYRMFPSSRSPGSGAFVSDAPKLASTVGLLPVTGEPFAHTHPNTGYYTKIPDGYQATARLFKATFERVSGVAECFSSLLQGKPIIVGRRGHSIYYLFVVYRNGRWYVAYVNSWGNWGDVCNEHVGNCIGWDTVGNMATSGYACVEVVHRSSLILPGDPEYAVAG